MWELRADLLSSTSPAFVSQQISLLRANSELPILFTVRTVSQGGKFPDEMAVEALELLQLAVEAGCDYVDVETSWPVEAVDKLRQNKADTILVASWTDPTGAIRLEDAVLQEKYIQAEKIGDIVMLSILATTEYDSHELALFLRDHRQKHHKPLIAMGLGTHGQLSRVVSPVSFITHALLPGAGAPGQMSLAQIQQSMHLLGQLPARNFFIFGNNIAHSLSPTLHNTAFTELGLPHHYSIHETFAVDEGVREIMSRPDFGGASVTFPHKLQIGQFLQTESAVARLIGAVNTVLVRTGKDGSRQLVGDNTDWLGIKSCIEVNWPDGGTVTARAAIVIGAGGASRAACYAVQQLGVKTLYMINRTRAKAEALAEDFPALTFVHYSSFAEFPAAGADPAPSIIVGCVPADDFVEEDIPSAMFAAVENGVLVEMAYRPLETALMKRGKRFNGWKITRGVDVLKEQAYHQFHMWTGRRAPKRVMAQAVDAKVG
ncbi:type I 3-dehydroquinase-domain-containing protein [Tricharina praecox]|uniref:type I 3-dehydroquinase-domain-containing protein n=1 Tax=Tricharina praecox TaxID=43433 RepID=UPI00221F2171|nr:type I 3-dehydroquinase-domain-containing protein [Tricharina praecox]KAI5858680.1 type I 3-dehydroquinase-domain-containing protein [Tricharina praecox]